MSERERDTETDSRVSERERDTETDSRVSEREGQRNRQQSE